MTKGQNKTLYVKEADAEVWSKAKKYLAFHEDKSLSEFFSDCLRVVVEKYERGQS